ncbi:MAG: nitrilase, partial [Fermentimonas sp.]|nr:nitrilase [Fermentimonas sp.]
MNNLVISTAQFENRSGDKDYNLSVIEKLTKEAKGKGADVVSFHECSVTGYTFAKNLSKSEMLQLAEYIPEGESVQRLISIANENDITILAGLFEKDESDNLFNTYVCVNKDGLVAKHRKIHPFISRFLSPGNSYTVFDINGWKCGILI